MAYLKSPKHTGIDQRSGDFRNAGEVDITAGVHSAGDGRCAVDA